MRYLFSICFVVLVQIVQAQQNYFNNTYDFQHIYNANYSIIQLPDSGFLESGNKGLFTPSIDYTYFNKYNKNGVFQAAIQYGNGSVIDGFAYIFRNSINNLYCQGIFRPQIYNYPNQISLYRITDNGDTLWKKTYGIDSLNENSRNIIDNGSHFLMCSEAFDYPNGDTEKMVLIKTDYSGNQIFYKSYQPNVSYHYVANSLVKLSNGDIEIGRAHV